MRANNKKILVADDDLDILDAIKMILEEVSYQVKTTADGQIDQVVKDFKPDLLLLDIWMSGLNGKDICKHLKSQKFAHQLPIIMISANRDTEKIAKEAGADDFIAKPFQMDELLDKVAKYVN